MRNFEVFNTVEELKQRIDQLRSTGYGNQEFEVVTANEPTGTVEDYYDVRVTDGDPSILDKFAAFITGKDATDRVFDKYEWDEYVKEQAREAVNNGQYVLIVHREGFYENEENFSPEEEVVFDERTGQPMSVAGVMDEAQETFGDRYNDDPQNLHVRDHYEEDLAFDDRTGQPLPK